MGALAGFINGGLIVNCYATGRVTALNDGCSQDQTWSLVGGLAGNISNGGKIHASFSFCERERLRGRFTVEDIGGLTGTNASG